MNNQIAASELPLQSDGAIYHLNLHPEELADNVILVGDPGRVSMISGMLDTVEVRKQNRELITHTGTYKGKRISVVSTGMGTDNIDIVLTELDALANVDLATRTVRSEHRTLNLVRIGTSGALRADLECGTFLASAYGLGIDGMLRYYDTGDIVREDVVDAFVRHTEWSPSLPTPYCTAASRELLDRIGHDMRQGITVSAPGFFGPQGRQVRARLHYPEDVRVSRQRHHQYGDGVFGHLWSRQPVGAPSVDRMPSHRQPRHRQVPRQLSRPDGGTLSYCIGKNVIMDN